ncbi:hypothetical protein [Clostridium beijerinckii]|nr:hypothetical protein [Clostridium beijerinckii]
MKVKELILKLQELDRNQEICVKDETTLNDEVIKDVYQNEDGTYYL